MSKIYERYKELKGRDPDKMYLFKCGKFYIFLDEDCEKINEYIVLKKVSFCKSVLKCGFPINALEDYMRVFNNHHLNIEIIDHVEDVKTNPEALLKLIRKIDIENITPMEAIVKLKEIKELVDEERS